MVKKEKHVALLISGAVITFQQPTRALTHLGYEKDESGAGSRVCFQRLRGDGSTHRIRLHKPHPGNDVKRYARAQVLESLKKEKLI